MIFRGRRGTHNVSPYALFAPSIGGLLVFGAIFAGTHSLWPLFGFSSHADRQAQSNTITVGYDTPMEDELPASLTVTRIRSVYDGDTFRIESLELVSADDKGIPIRIRGVDAPEIDGECEREQSLADVSRRWLVERLRHAESVTLSDLSYSDDPYDRVLAKVFVDGNPLSDQMINSGVATRYTGGKRRSWCGRE